MRRLRGWHLCRCCWRGRKSFLKLSTNGLNCRGAHSLNNDSTKQNDRGKQSTNSPVLGFVFREQIGNTSSNRGNVDVDCLYVTLENAKATIKAVQHIV